MRTINKIHKAAYSSVAGLTTYTAFPQSYIEHIDPFLLLNHHGPQIFPPDNTGLPFGPHPHRGIETVTFIIDGDVVHKDSQRNESLIGTGGVQWMTAGSGILHSEVSSEVFKEIGGNLEILQLWINLPSHLKMINPTYKGFQREDIPTFYPDEGIKVDLIAGNWENGHQGVVEPFLNLMLCRMEFQKGTALDMNIPAEQNILFYLIKGELTVNGNKVEPFNAVEFANDGDYVSINAMEESIVIFGRAESIQEPVVAKGPFVMNSEEEIEQAYLDFNQGKMGAWQ